MVVRTLSGGSTEMPKNWNRRFKHNRDKMKTGDILELAEVVRNLSLRDHEKGLSTGEKQMFVKAKKILASELMYAKDMDEEEAAEWLDDVLLSSPNGVPNGRKKGTTSAKPAKVASKTAAKPAARKPAARKTATKPAAKAKPKTKARAASR
jgi:CarD family transcriptional regulator